MPTYEYRCAACDHQFEEFQSITAPVKRKCPKCGKAKLERLIGIGAGVIFKGGGFYETDYRSDSYKKAADADKKAGEPTSVGSKSGDSKTGESKTVEAAKPEAKTQHKPEPPKTRKKSRE